MIGHTNKREQNYEIKYLRKALGQIDARIQTPQSVNAASLRSLLDDIPTVSPREDARRPKWLSLKSGIAYAAAFTLIVALFYSMEYYKPEMINGGMTITPVQEDASAFAAAEEAPKAETLPSRPQTVQTASASEAEASEAVRMPEAETSPENSGEDDAIDGDIPAVGNVGGGGRAVLLLEDGERAYYGRTNDISDPHRPGPATLEIVDAQSQEIVTLVDIPAIYEIKSCFVLGDTVLVVGNGDGGVVMRAYSGLDSEGDGPAEQLALEQPGEYMSARVYKDVVHIASMSDTVAAAGEVIELPNANSPDSCVITAIDLATFEAGQKTFAGAKGTVQLHNLNAYIYYEGDSEDGSAEKYIGQVLFDGTDIELGSVS